MELLEAAHVVQDIYKNPNSRDVEEQIDINGVQAYVLKGGILVIPGTNEFSDWFDFNFDVFDSGGSESHGFSVVSGDSGVKWHAGFLEHAQYVYAFAKPQKLKLVIGHSLGAASAQIVGWSLGLPTIAFASPKTCRGVSKLDGTEKVLNLCRSDDTVCHVPPGFLRFKHVGKTIWMNPDGIDFGEDHRIDEYIEIMKEPRFKELLPKSWPA